MSFILHIDTAGQTASIAISANDTLLVEKLNTNQFDHASWIHTAIQEAMLEVNLPLEKLDAISVTIGPGSYTGLRVGLSTAKGLCYALEKPLITIPTLQLMASVIECNTNTWICPMIDARRMEVYYAMYDQALNEIQPAQALILNTESFLAELETHKIIFCGNGMEKFKPLCSSANASFSSASATAAAMIPIALGKLLKKEFADLAYCTPLYVKEFYSGSKS
ncbi:MAG: tRNA ((37)-N6)-threonylcarbamoyltransferase complex dimerization subunit type 1 TsaB [Bacteroidota bacterium]